MSATLGIGNHAGTAVPIAVDASGNVGTAAVGPVNAPARVSWAPGRWASLAATPAGEVKVVLVGTTNTGTLVPVQVATTGAMEIV